MGLISDMEERIRIMSLKEAYNFMTSEDGVPDELYKKVRYGNMGLKIDIYDYINGFITMKAKTGIVIYRAHRLKMEDIHSDMEERLKLIKQYLLDKYRREARVGPR